MKREVIDYVPEQDFPPQLPAWCRGIRDHRSRQLHGTLCSRLCSAGEESAFELKRLLKIEGLRASEENRGEAEFYVSDRPEDFERTASMFLREDLHHTARRIDIDRY